MKEKYNKVIFIVGVVFMLILFFVGFVGPQEGEIISNEKTVNIGFAYIFTDFYSNFVFQEFVVGDIHSFKIFAIHTQVNSNRIVLKYIIRNGCVIQIAIKWATHMVRPNRVSITKKVIILNYDMVSVLNLDSMVIEREC